MIFVDLAHKRPTDTDIPDWEPWPEERWQAWLDKSKALVDQMKALEQAGKRDERNAVIDANRAHWGQLKPWLQVLSGGKDWFTGVRELYSHYEVEHFRPKKLAWRHDGHDDDGYWWLAFDYMNLRLCGNVGNRKKGGWFPLQDQSACSAWNARCEEMEVPYLLDPIDDMDVSLIAFNEEGRVIAVPNSSAWERERVEETARRLKLNEHTPLVEERRKIWQQATRLITDYKAARARCGRGNNMVIKEQLKHICRELRQLADKRAELSSVARWCLLLGNDPQLARLIGS